MKPTFFSSLAGAVFLFSAAGIATAGPVWNVSNCASASSYLSATCTSTGTTKYSASVSAWSASSTGKFGAAYVYPFAEGLGVVGTNETSSPQHAIDNNGSTDAVLLSFGTDFALKQLSSGWIYGDADVSILRYTGSAAPALGSFTIGTLGATATSGWELVGNYSIANVNTPLDFNAANKTASWWLVSAYNSKYGGNTAGLDNGDDYLKLKSFSGDFIVTKPDLITVPEPGTWSLMGIAILGIALSRRRPQA